MGTTLHLIPGPEGSECAIPAYQPNSIHPQQLMSKNGFRLFLAMPLLIAFILCWANKGIGQTATYSVPGNYNFIVPPGVTSVTVKAWGGGGGGGHSDGGNGGQSGGGGGGGGGGYRTGTFTVTPGQTISIVV
ncbi:MAG TPA: hypothetical protein PKE06_12090, partial [Flavilitoribacter sp.]|nr:hypothetical protein [Flavilitoribacter sp.]